MIKFTHICCVCVSTIFTETEVYTLWHHVAMRPGFRLSRPGFRLNRPNMAQRPNVYASRPSEGQLVNWGMGTSASRSASTKRPILFHWRWPILGTKASHIIRCNMEAQLYFWRKKRIITYPHQIFVCCQTGLLIDALYFAMWEFSRGYSSWKSALLSSPQVHHSTLQNCDIRVLSIIQWEFRGALKCYYCTI